MKFWQYLWADGVISFSNIVNNPRDAERTSKSKQVRQNTERATEK